MARQPDYRDRLFDHLAFLLRYGPKSIDEILSRTVCWNIELGEAIGRLMGREKTSFEQNLLTGDS